MAGTIERIVCKKGVRMNGAWYGTPELALMVGGRIRVIDPGAERPETLRAASGRILTRLEDGRKGK